MSATKRASVRRQTPTKKTAKKTVRKTAAARVAKKTPKKVTKKATQKVATKVTKKTTKKSAQKVVTGSRRKRVATTTQSVREARYGGHQNTVPKHPNAPGRILGRSFTLGALGAAHVPLNTDALAVGLARISGVAVMLAGVALSWQLYNQLASVPVTAQTASVVTSTPIPELTVSVTSETPLQDTVPLVVGAPAAEDVVLVLQNASSTQVLGAATQRTAETWELVFDTTTVPNGSYELYALALQADAFTAATAAETVVVANTVTVPTTTAATTSTTSSTVVRTDGVSASSAATSSIARPVVAAPPMVASTSMPTLLAPTVRLLAPITGQETLVVGEGSAKQPVELLLLRDQQRATTTVQSNGWWSLRVATPQRGDTYELYAQAGPELLSQPLDFTVINGRLTQPSSGQEQTTATANSDPTRDMLLWYLVTAIATVAVGAVVLLLGHHLHYTRRRPTPTRAAELDQVE